jgi:integrase
MPTRKLTDLFVERVRAPASGRIEYFDASFPGLALRVTENGSKSWSVFYRFSGRLRRFTIGSYPAIKPAQARREAQAALEQVRAKVDPAEEKRAQRQRSPEKDTFGIVARDYLDRHVRANNRPSTIAEAERDLNRDALRVWDKRPIGSITRRDAIDLIDEIVERGARVQANRTLTRLGALFDWAVEKERLAVSPVAGMKRPTQEQARDRVLTDDEIRWLWSGSDLIGWPFGPMTKLLLLTAQRRDEVAGLTWAEVDSEKSVWTIPGQRAKNGRLHEVQLSAKAMEILRSLPHIGDDLAFTTTGDTTISGFSRSKRRLDEAMITARRRELGLPEGDDGLRKKLKLPAGKPLPVEIPNWTLHDLRRTAATGMARLNFPPHVVDKILNHTGGTIRGVAAVYNRFAYMEERRNALEAWARYVECLKSSAPANVVQLRA